MRNLRDLLPKPQASGLTFILIVVILFLLLGGRRR